MAQAFFISYASQDASHAQEICGLLKRLGAAYWIAPDSIMPGEPYAVTIAKAIRESLAVLLLFSRSSDQSAAVMNEITLARNHQKRVVPIRLENYQPNTLEYYLSATQWIDFYDPQKPEGQRRLQRLVTDLCGVSDRLSFSASDTGQRPSNGIFKITGSIGPGDLVASHTVLEMIGSGSVGQIYRARENSSGRIDAIWVLQPALTDREELLNLCRDGIQIQSTLHHPNITAVHTPLMVGIRPGMVMEYVEGFSIEALLKNAPIPAAVAIPAAMQVLEALSYMHARGVIHRNLKPDACILNSSGRLKLQEFHVAYQCGVSRPPDGRIIGSAQYMPPEQIHGEEPDPRSDLYSLGITLYEMVTGQLPFAGGSEFSIMQAHLQQTPRAPIDIASVVPQRLSDVIVTAMSKDPAARFGSADAMRNALIPMVSGNHSSE